MITVKGETEFPAFTYDKEHTFHAIASIQAPKFEEISRASRAPIDLIVVIDASGSMAGEKLALVKNTLHFVVNQLKKEDRLSIISFNSEGTLHSSLTELTPTGKGVANKMIDSRESWK
eukprot:TRINITY_DN16710_c0_g1_i1.p1 TRINITY_DN16710_c0_g1~~TRINITY_DN16710_c0_g1_i1.p1  ORF type:complete len:118 (-),score=23.47 TRINITY_DN16710_c0_g1_i1:101-454(-)